jgi:hypothetical protein
MNFIHKVVNLMFTKIKLFFKSFFSKSTSIAKKAFGTVDSLISSATTAIEKGDLVSAKTQINALLSAVKVVVDILPAGKYSESLTAAMAKLSEAINSEKVEEALKAISEITTIISAIKVII